MTAITSVDCSPKSRRRIAEYIFTGNPCKNGHIGPRYKNGNCVECLLERERQKYADPAFREQAKARARDRHIADRDGRNAKARQRRITDGESVRQEARDYYRKNAEVIKALSARYRARYPEKVRNSRRRYDLENSEKRRLSAQASRERHAEKRRASCREFCKKHYAENPAYYAEKRATRRLIEAGQTPLWANRDRIREIYAEAKKAGLSVDHIVPLRGKLRGKHVVCGLHCEANLQLMPLDANKAKNCHVWPDM